MTENPSAPESALNQLRNALLTLHKALLDSERASYEHDVQKIESTGQFFGLVMDDPWFAWLRELSRFVVQIDERLDAEEPVAAEEAARLLDRARSLLTPSEHGFGFEKHYYEAMQRDPGVVLAHAAATRVISGLRAA